MLYKQTCKYTQLNIFDQMFKYIRLGLKIFDWETWFSPGVYQDSRETPGFQWNRGIWNFSPGFYQGESWETGVATRREFQLFPRYIRGIPQVTVWFLVESQLSPRFFPWWTPGVFQVVTWCLPGGAPGDENLVFTWVFTRYFASGENNLVNTRGKPGIYRFSRKTDKYQGKIGFPGKYQVKP